MAKPQSSPAPTAAKYDGSGGGLQRRRKAVGKAAPPTASKVAAKAAASKAVAPGRGAARGQAKRRRTLGVELSRRFKKGGLLDRRLGEAGGGEGDGEGEGGTAASDEAAIRRFAAQKRRVLAAEESGGAAAARMRAPTEAEDSGLLAAVNKFAPLVTELDDAEDDDDDADGGRGRMSSEALFDEGGLLRRGASLKDRMELLIAQTRAGRADKREQLEETRRLTDAIDAEWKTRVRFQLGPLMVAPAPAPASAAAAPVDPAGRLSEFEQLSVQLMQSQRLVPKDDPAVAKAGKTSLRPAERRSAGERLAEACRRVERLRRARRLRAEPPPPAPYLETGRLILRLCNLAGFKARRFCCLRLGVAFCAEALGDCCVRRPPTGIKEICRILLLTSVLKRLLAALHWPMCPELLAALRSLLELAAPAPPAGDEAEEAEEEAEPPRRWRPLLLATRAAPPGWRPGPLPLSLCQRASALASCDAPGLRLRCLHRMLAELGQLLTAWRGCLPAAAVRAAFLPLAEAVGVAAGAAAAAEGGDAWPRELRAEADSFLSAVSACSAEAAGARLAREREPPKMLELLEPQLELNFDPDRKRRRCVTAVANDDDAAAAAAASAEAAAENQRLRQLRKREMKAAVREVARDRDFLAGERLDRTLRADGERKRKVKELMGALGNQEGEVKKLMKRGR